SAGSIRAARLQRRVWRGGPPIRRPVQGRRKAWRRCESKRETTMFRKILVGNDGSEGAKKALHAAIDLAKRYEAELHEISGEERLPHYDATVGEVVEAKQEATEIVLTVRRNAEMGAT